MASPRTMLPIRRLAAPLTCALATALLLATPLEAVQRGGAQRGAQRGAPQRGEAQDPGPRSAGRQPRARTDRPQSPGRLVPAGDDRAGQRGAPLGDAPEEEVYPFGYPAEQRQRLYFTMADANNSEWISFREAQDSLRFDAPRFRIFDGDNDGRMTFEEFSDFVLGEAAAGRIVPEPIQRTRQGRPPQRTPDQLRTAYDVDLDGAISGLELEQALDDYQGDSPDRVDARAMLDRLDSNGTAVLEMNEIERLASFLAPLVADPGLAGRGQPGARSVIEMFGQPIDRGETIPPQIVGPVPPFHRLDVDGDGFVDLDDLEALEGATFAPVRLKSVLNTLDIDYDGRLSEAEFLSSMTPKRRAPASGDDR